MKNTKTKAWLRRNGPAILTGSGILLMGSGTPITAYFTPKIEKILHEKKEEKGEELTKIEKAKVTWKYWLPIVAVEVSGAVCLIASNVLSSKENAAVTAAYLLTESAYKDYRKKVEEIFGDKAGEVKKAIIDDKIKEHPVPEKIQNKPHAEGDDLYYESISGRYFWSNRNKIEKAVNELNAQMVHDMYVSLNDFYYLLDSKELEPIGIGENIGWNINEDKLLSVSFDTRLDPNNHPAVVLEYDVPPNYSFNMYD